MHRFGFEHRQLEHKGKCICCGKEIRHKDEKVIVFRPHKSQVYQVTICDDCIREMNKLIQE